MRIERQRISLWALASILLATARCSAPPAPADAGDVTDVVAASDGSDVVRSDAPARCTTDNDCSDMLFCDGVERCSPSAAGADARGCVAASPATPCAAAETCDESADRCVGTCTGTADADGDGHRSPACGGDDCDDTDSNRFPGNPEVCDTAGHDEDCDLATIGSRDGDGDGAIDGTCCNVRTDGSRACGPDCDDARADVHPGAMEICDGRDNDCHGGADDDPGASEACGTAPNAQLACRFARCIVGTCDPGRGDCDGLAANGCEADIGTVLNCGGCGRTCAIPNATAACTGGACQIASCDPGYHDCGGTRCAADDSITSCGASCVTCPLPPDHARAVCVAGACDFACDPGYVRSATACTSIPAPRLLEPMSTSIMSTQNPRLRWLSAAPATGARIEICQDRACAFSELHFDVAGSGGLVPVRLSPGVHFWRAVGLAGAVPGVEQSATWEFVIGRRNPAHNNIVGHFTDTNGDGYADILTTGTAVSVFAGSADGPSSTPTTNLSVPGGIALFPTSLSNAGDFNGDGFGDIVAAGENPSRERMAFLYFGGPAGPSDSPATLSTFTGRVASVEDLDGDGYGDIASADTSAVQIVFGGPAAPFRTASVSLPISCGATTAIAGGGDFDGDGRPDFFVICANGGTEQVLSGFTWSSGRVASRAMPYRALSSCGQSVLAAGADVDGDGLADVAIKCTSDVRVYQNGVLDPRVIASSMGGTAIAISPDLNADGIGDIVVGDASMNRVAVFDGVLAALPSTPRFIASTSGFGGSLCASGDINADGIADLVAGTGSIRVLLGDIGGLPGAPTYTITASSGSLLAP